jgi:hypothetical protein
MLPLQCFWSWRSSFNSAKAEKAPNLCPSKGEACGGLKSIAVSECCQVWAAKGPVDCASANCCQACSIAIDRSTVNVPLVGPVKRNL